MSPKSRIASKSHGTARDHRHHPRRDLPLRLVSASPRNRDLLVARLGAPLAPLNRLAYAGRSDYLKDQPVCSLPDVVSFELLQLWRQLYGSAQGKQ